MKTFFRLLATALVVVTTNNFVWFALIFWAFLSTKSVISTSTMGGIFLVLMAVTGVWFGSIVDHHKKKHAMLGSSVATLLAFAIGLLFLHVAPAGAFASVSSPWLWILAILLLCGTIAGTIYNIAIPTLIGLTVPEEGRDRANGMFGTVIGIAFGITSVASGVALAYLGMKWVIGIAIAATLVAIAMLALTPVEEREIVHMQEGGAKKVDLEGTIAAVRAIPGLFALIFYTTFNNFLGGVFMALMDAYGLTLVSVQVWGFLWGFLSMGFIVGGVVIAKRGLGSNPLRTFFRVNFAVWTVCIFFTIQPSIVLLAVGTFIWMMLFPFIEAIEQTIFQKVVPPERLGRVIGFAHGVEQSASPLTAFIIGPIAQFVFIPFMTSGRGVEWIGGWYGTGMGRGIALVFTTAGIVGLAIAMIARRSRAYGLLSSRYEAGEADAGAGDGAAAP
ncbi:MAG TPA: MFS transporter [Thermoanaerobaculia bacterium]|nr:MFS transporter [Thermoanaerobaculia bacterium]